VVSPRTIIQRKRYAQVMLGEHFRWGVSLWDVANVDTNAAEERVFEIH
jgi:hypothetical protein